MKKGVSTIWIPITSNLWKVQKRDTFFNGSQHNFFPFDISDEGIWQSTLKCWQERVLACRDVLCDQFFEVKKPEFISNLTEHFSVHTYLWQDSLDCPSRFFCQVLPVKNKYYATDFCYVASHNRLQSFQTTHVKKCRKSSDFFCPQGAASPALWYLVIWNSFLGPVPLCGRNKWDEMHFHEQTHCTMMEGLPNLLYSPSSFFFVLRKM